MRDIVRIGRDAPRDRGRRGTVTARRGPRPRAGVVGGLPLRREPRRAADPARGRRLRRARRRGRRGPGAGRQRRPRAAGASRSAGPSARGRWPSRRRTPCSSAARCPATRRRPSRPPCPGTRVDRRLVEVWEDAWQAGGCRWTRRRWARAGSSRDLARIRQAAGHHRAGALVARGTASPGRRSSGASSFEVFGQYGADTFSDPKRPLRAPPRGAGRGGRAAAVLSQRASARPTARPEKMQPPRKVPSSAL